MPLPQPFKYERRIVGASVVDEHKDDGGGAIEKTAVFLRWKPPRFVEAWHRNDDFARS
jgi:hypothetical protein